MTNPIEEIRKLENQIIHTADRLEAEATAPVLITHCQVCGERIDYENPTEPHACKEAEPIIEADAPDGEEPENREFNDKWHLVSSNRKSAVNGKTYQRPGESLETANVGAWYESACYWRDKAEVLSTRQADENYVAWIRYDRQCGKTTIKTCDCNAEGAFKVYRHPSRQADERSLAGMVIGLCWEDEDADEVIIKRKTIEEIVSKAKSNLRNP